MFNKLKKIYLKYFRREETPYFEILNYLILVSVLFVIAITYDNYYSNHPLAVYSKYFSLVFHFIAFLLNYKRKYFFAKFCYIFSNILSLFFSSLIFGKYSNTQIYFVNFIGLAFLLFTNKEKVYKYLALLVATFFFLIIQFSEFNIQTDFQIPHEVQEELGNKNLVGFIFCITFYFILNEFLRSRAEEKLDSFNSNLNSIVDGIENGIVVLDLNGIILNLNPNAYSIFKPILKEKLFLGKNFFNQIDYVFSRELKINFDSAVSGNESSQVLENFMAQNNSLKISFTPILDNYNIPKRILVSGIDTTSFKKIESILKKYIQDFDTIFQSAKQIIWFFDKDGRILNANKFALEFNHIKMPISEMIGKKVSEVMNYQVGFIFQEDVENVIKNKVSIFNQIEYIDEISCISSDKIINLDANGEVIGLSIFAKDITTERISEQRLRLLTSVVLNAQDSILITEAEPIEGDGPKLVFVNQSFTKQTGYTLDEVYGKTPRILQGLKTDKEILANVKKALKEWKPVHAELINYDKWGNEFWVEFDIVPIADEKGRFTHWISTQRIITERKRIERELIIQKEKAEVASKYKSQFLANMSHEIRTPLNAILGFTEELLIKENNPERKLYLELIQNSGDNLLKLLNDILDISKIEEGKLAFSPIEFNLKELVDSIIIPYQIRANEKGNTLLLEFDENLPIHFFEDSHRIRQVIINLIGNSIKFTNRGKIKLKVQLLNYENNIANIEFKVSDSGIGILEENQKLIFESFTQEDDSMTRKYGGTGLGLTISKYLVSMMSGEIKIQSPSNEFTGFEIVGSDFYFILPMRIINKNQILKTTEAKKNLFFEKKLNLLVAEDNETNQLLIKKVLSKMNAEVTIVNNGEEAVEYFRDNQYDAILMDIQMPILDGYKATEIIRSLKHKKQIPIIAVSANVYKDEIDNSVRVGMDAYITKPFKQIEIFETLEKLLFQKKENS